VDVRVLIVSPYPPDRCGIASYTVQVAATLRREGHTVEVISPDPSAARYSADCAHTVRGVLRVLALSRRADRTIVEFFPDLLFKSLRRSQFLRQWPAVALLFALGREVHLIVHEAPYRSLKGRKDLRGRVARAMWRTLLTLPDATFVHTAWERDQLVEATGVPAERFQILPHGESFLKRVGTDRERARRELGLDEGERQFRFLSIGFLQPHKGFDRAMRALARLQADHVRLDVVGSVRVQSRDVDEYMERLRRLAASTPGVTLHEGYVSDERFDRWIVASDAIVLPYREIWSSGVLERAKLYGRPAIVSDVGGMGDQADSSTRVVRDDDELCAAMAELAGVPVSPGYAPATEGLALSYEGAREIVLRRAAALRERHEPGTAVPETAGTGGGSALPHPVALPAPPAGRGLRARLKRTVDRLIRWELAPLVSAINELRDYVADHPQPPPAAAAEPARPDPAPPGGRGVDIPTREAARR
jgi:glycosyltransferase involved in cell wall biosynthesis